MPIQMALRPKARICGAYPAIGYGKINVFGHSQKKANAVFAFRALLKNLMSRERLWISDLKDIGEIGL